MTRKYSDNLRLLETTGIVKKLTLEAILADGFNGVISEDFLKTLFEKVDKAILSNRDFIAKNTKEENEAFVKKLETLKNKIRQEMTGRNADMLLLNKFNNIIQQYKMAETKREKEEIQRAAIAAASAPSMAAAPAPVPPAAPSSGVSSAFGSAPVPPAAVPASSSTSSAPASEASAPAAAPAPSVSGEAANESGSPESEPDAQDSEETEAPDFMGGFTNFAEKGLEMLEGDNTFLGKMIGGFFSGLMNFMPIIKSVVDTVMPMVNQFTNLFTKGFGSIFESVGSTVNQFTKMFTGSDARKAKPAKKTQPAAAKAQSQQSAPKAQPAARPATQPHPAPKAKPAPAANSNLEPGLAARLEDALDAFAELAGVPQAAKASASGSAPIFSGLPQEGPAQSFSPMFTAAAATSVPDSPRAETPVGPSDEESKKSRRMAFGSGSSIEVV